MPSVRDRRVVGDVRDSGAPRSVSDWDRDKPGDDVHRVFQEFADGTSMHGVPRIINARSIPARFFWSIICMGAFGMFLWQCGILLGRYYSYPKKVNVEIVQSPVPFPAVSVCNTDFLDLEIAKHLEAAINPSDDMMNNDSSAEAPIMENSTRDFLHEYVMFQDLAIYLLPVYQKVYETREAKLHEDMGEIFSRLGLVANLGPQLSSKGSIRLQNFIINCRFMDDDCNATKSFRRIFDPYYFNCFTFLPQTILSSSATRLQGVEYGLTLLLFTRSAGQVNVSKEMGSEEMASSLYLPGLQESDSALASGEGVRLVVHSPGTRPHPTADGYDIPLGYSVTIGVKARENVRIRKPHGNCSAFQNPDPDKEGIWTEGPDGTMIRPEYRYTLMDCQKECIQRRIMATCGCVDIRINEVDNPDNLPYCFTVPAFTEECQISVIMALVEGNQSLIDPRCVKVIKEFSQSMECRKKVYENMTIRDPDSMSKCQCYPPCNDYIYDARYSLSTLPEYGNPSHTSFYSKIEKFIDNLPESKTKILNDTFGKEYEHRLLKDVIRLNVHISDSNIIKTTESPDYEAIRLVSDIGGQLGLWIGISVMTIFEVLQLVADILRFLTAKGRNVGERRAHMDGEIRNNRYGNGDQRYIRPSNLDPDACEIDHLTTV